MVRLNPLADCSLFQYIILHSQMVAWTFGLMWHSMLGTSLPVATEAHLTHFSHFSKCVNISRNRSTPNQHSASTLSPLLLALWCNKVSMGNRVTPFRTFSNNSSFEKATKLDALKRRAGENELSHVYRIFLLLQILWPEVTGKHMSIKDIRCKFSFLWSYTKYRNVVTFWIKLR